MRIPLDSKRLLQEVFGKGDAIATREVLDRVVGRASSLDTELDDDDGQRGELAPAMYDEQVALEEGRAMLDSVPPARLPI